MRVEPPGPPALDGAAKPREMNGNFFPTGEWGSLQKVPDIFLKWLIENLPKGLQSLPANPVLVIKTKRPNKQPRSLCTYFLIGRLEKLRAEVIFFPS